MRRAGQRWGREIDRGIGDRHKIDVDADTAQARRKVADLDRDINKRRTVEIDVDASRVGPAMSAMSGQVSGVTDSFTGLGAAISALGKVGGPIVMVGLAGALVEVAGVAAAASQALLVLPAAAGAAGAAFGTLKLGMMGFTDAMESIRDPEKFAAALQSLAPNAQQAALAIQAILPAFDQLKNATQDALFAGVGPTLNNLANQFLPRFSR